MTNWRQVKLGEIGEIISGGTPSTAEPLYWDGTIPWVTPTEITKLKGKYICDTERNITEAGYKNSSANLLPKKSLILCSRATIGEVAINSCELTTNQGFKNIIPNDHLNIYFLYYWAKINKKAFYKISAGSTFLEFGKKDLEKIPLLLPPLPEQEKIVEVLTTWDEYLEKLDGLIAAKRELKKGLMQELLTGKRRLPGFDGKCEEVKLGEVLKIGSGKDYKHLEVGEIPVFGTGGYMLSVNECLGDGETVFIGRKGTIDKPFYFKGKFWTVDTLFYTHSFKNINVKFLSYKFRTINWLRYNEASGVPSLSKTTIEKIKISLPPLPEQTAIAEILSTADAQIDALVSKREAISEQRKYLLENLVTGKIRVV